MITGRRSRQGRGIGPYLLLLLARQARAIPVRRFIRRFLSRGWSEVGVLV
ncbi:hypothetical protein PM3016_7439 [Paenibacillus mucilaginosus 3016]|uniref:Uncharacterized protein n=3 Tax=Paenibacillus mucilaginosus TaxID=61624 RepID=H6NIV5_9BACL|nr:hypothetical protein KNP414_07923 [Paenibacillus mucilaginosus KNP414]AFC34005.1 hypothetical protein PM3016_7439 [Paenibacillus mucilaginosus 3016]AFH66333.1 hypothetical protein B2K_37510 [Paenibacillus mucilaginosus K02]